MLDDINAPDITPAPAGALGFMIGVYGSVLRLFDSTAWETGRRRAPRTVTGASTVLDADDQGRMVIMTHTAGVNYTIVTNAVTPVPIGTVIEVMRGGAGQVTIVASAGVNLIAAGRPRFRVLGSVGTLEKIDTDTWVWFGDTAA